ncbi:MAG: copper homeostasis protein CutC [Longimicrobiales bacterium]
MTRATSAPAPLLEACVTTGAEAEAAVAAGAHRLELCVRLDADGLTPPPELVAAVTAAVAVPVVVLVRPRDAWTARPGEVDAMADRVAAAVAAGAAGVAVGVLTGDGHVDEAALRALVAAAAPRPVTFHKAFDRAHDLDRGLDAVLACGAARVLTSGGAATAWAGRETLARLVQRAGGALEVVAAGGVRADHAAALVRATGVPALHARAAAFPALAEALGRA